MAELTTLEKQAGEEQPGEPVSRALPIQERHLARTKECSLKPAAEEDPYE